MPLSSETKSALQRAIRALRPQLAETYAATNHENAAPNGHQAVLGPYAGQRRVGGRS